MADAAPASVHDPAHETPSAAQLRVLMEHLNRFSPVFSEVAKGVADRRAADRRAGDRKTRVDIAVAELTPLLPLADTPPHMGRFQLPESRVASMAVAIHNQKVPDDMLIPVRRLVNSDDAKSVLADAIRELHRRGVQYAPERVAALYIASRLSKIEGQLTMRKLTKRRQEIRRLTSEFDRRLHGAIQGLQEERGLQGAVRGKGRTGLGKGRTGLGGGWCSRTRKRHQSKSKKGRRGRKGTRRA